MNTPEQIANKWAELMYAHKPVDFDSFKECFNSAMAEATQPLYQRLIAAEMRVALWSATIQKYHSWKANGVPAKDFPDAIIADYQKLSKLMDTNRTYDAFMAMMKALEGLFPLVHVESKEGLALASAIQLAKEVAG